MNPYSCTPLPFPHRACPFSLDLCNAYAPTCPPPSRSYTSMASADCEPGRLTQWAPHRGPCPACSGTTQCCTWCGRRFACGCVCMNVCARCAYLKLYFSVWARRECACRVCLYASLRCLSLNLKRRVCGVASHAPPLLLCRNHVRAAVGPAGAVHVAVVWRVPGGGQHRLHCEPHRARGPAGSRARTRACTRTNTASLARTTKVNAHAHTRAHSSTTAPHATAPTLCQRWCAVRMRVYRVRDPQECPVQP
jgi:hypothetical protein